MRKNNAKFLAQIHHGNEKSKITNFRKNKKQKAEQKSCSATKNAHKCKSN